MRACTWSPPRLEITLWPARKVRQRVRGTLSRPTPSAPWYNADIVFFGPAAASPYQAGHVALLKLLRDGDEAELPSSFASLPEAPDAMPDGSGATSATAASGAGAGGGVGAGGAGSSCCVLL